MELGWKWLPNGLGCTELRWSDLQRQSRRHQMDSRADHNQRRWLDPQTSRRPQMHRGGLWTLQSCRTQVKEDAYLAQEERCAILPRWGWLPKYCPIWWDRIRRQSVHLHLHAAMRGRSREQCLCGADTREYEGISKVSQFYDLSQFGTIWLGWVPWR